MCSEKVLVVDDDAMMRALLRRTLEGEGFVVLEADHAAEVLRIVAEHDLALVALDLGLGGENGFDIARAIRKTSRVPIIMISGKTDVIDRVAGLETGADDYITKPFHPREVVARIRAVLRRTGGENSARKTSAAAEAADDTAVHFDGLTAYPDRLELRDRANEVAELTSGDFRLLQIFLDHPKRILSRERIMDLMHGTEYAPLDRTIDNQVARLRRKIEREPAKPTLIKTVRGIGYMFVAETSKVSSPG